MALFDDLMQMVGMSNTNAPPQGGAMVTSGVPVDPSLEEALAALEAKKIADAQMADRIRAMAEPAPVPSTVAPQAPQGVQPSGGYKTLEEALAARDTRLEAEGIPRSVSVEPLDTQVTMLNKGFQNDAAFRPTPAAVAAGASPNRIEATRQANGNIAFTNVGTEPIASVVQNKGNTPVTNLSVESIDGMLRDMQQGKSKEEIATILSTLNQQADSFMATKKAEALARRTTEVGLPALQAQLMKATEADNLAIASGKPELATNSLRVSAMIDKASALADSLATRDMENNLDVLRIKSKVSSSSPLIQEYSAKAGFSSEQARIDAKTLNDNPAFVTENAAILEPTKKNDPSALVATINKRSKEEQAIIQTDPRELPKAFLANPDSVVAKDLLAYRLSEGNPAKMPEALNTLDQMTRVMKDRKIFTEAFNTVYSGKDRETYAYLKNSPDTLPNKDLQKKQREEQADVAVRFMNVMATNKFRQEAEQWLPVTSVPELNKAVTDLRASGKPATLDNIASQYLNETPALAIERKNQLAKWIQDAAKVRNGKLVGNVDTQIMLDTLPLLVAPPRSRFDFALETAEAVLDSNLNNPIINSLGMLLNNAMVGVTQDVQRGVQWAKTPRGEEMPANTNPPNDVLKGIIR